MDRSRSAPDQSIQGAGARRARHPGNRHGFTLIELLVVISVLGIMVSMLLPVIELVRNAARSAVCKSNLRQITMAHIAYAGDWDEIMPWPDNATWPDQAKLEQYIDPAKDKVVWSCTDPKLKRLYGVYYMNWWALEPKEASHPGWGWHHDGPYSLAGIANKTEAAICADLDGGGKGGYHRGYSNIAFVDGHVNGKRDKALEVSDTIVYTRADPGVTVMAEYMSATWSNHQQPLKGWDY